MKLKTFNIIIIFLFISKVILSQTSDIDKLKAERLKYQKEIKQAQALLSKKGKSKSNFLSELDILNSKISNQNKVISIYKKEISKISDEINSNKKIADDLQSEINNIKKDYIKIIKEANRKRYTSFNEFMILFSSSSFSEAYRRFNLLRQYSNYRKKQGQILLNTKLEYDSIIKTNEVILNQKNDAFYELNEEIEKIKISISVKEKYIYNLQKEEKWLKKQIARKKAASKKLESTIEKLILEASKSKENTYSNFAQSKGKLGWPVIGGVVTSFFGEHNHAVLKGVKVKNNGIDITAPKQNLVKAVYEGTVSRVIAIPGYNKAIIVRHGKFLTVYANLVDVYVAGGDKVKSNQNLGLVFAEKDNNSGVLHFEIWEGSKKINPTNWLKK